MKAAHPQKLGPKETGKVLAASNHETLNFSEHKKLFYDTIPGSTSKEFFMPLLFSVVFHSAE